MNSSGEQLGNKSRQVYERVKFPNDSFQHRATAPACKHPTQPLPVAPQHHWLISVKGRIAITRSVMPQKNVVNPMSVYITACELPQRVGGVSEGKETNSLESLNICDQLGVAGFAGGKSGKHNTRRTP